MQRTEIIFDVETQRMFDLDGRFTPSKLGVSIVSAYIRTIDDALQEVSGEMRSFWEDELPELFRLFQDSHRIIGFNTISFDVPALQPYALYDLSTLPHFDLMVAFKAVAGHRIKLDTLAKYTLGKGKSDVGSNAVKYWEAGDPESLRKLQMYCEMDVEITKDLYDVGLHEGVLKYKDKWNENRAIDVDFSYPLETAKVEHQATLF